MIMRKKENQTSLNFVDTQIYLKPVVSSKHTNQQQSKKEFKIQISSSESFKPFMLSVYIRKRNSRIKVSLKHNQLFRENFNSSCSVHPKVIQLIPE